MVGIVVDEGISLLTGDAQADERSKNQQSVVAQDLHSAMAAPPVHGGEILGAIHVDTNDPATTYAEQDLRALRLLGQMLGALRALREAGISATEQVARLDRHLLQTTRADRYGTLFLAELDPTTHRLEYVNARHPPPFFVLPDGELPALEAFVGQEPQADDVTLLVVRRN